MTKEDKQLLLIDICARLLYRPNGVKLNKFGNEDIIVTGYTGRFIETLDGEVEVERIRLYLRPMASMTEEEKMHFWCLNHNPNTGVDFMTHAPELIDWLNENHFDYHGLIPMGLALEAPEGMYK